MKKELIICITIIVLIISANIITQNYTKSCVGKMNERIDMISEAVYGKLDLEENKKLEIKIIISSFAKH